MPVRRPIMAPILRSSMMNIPPPPIWTGAPTVSMSRAVGCRSRSSRISSGLLGSMMPLCLSLMTSGQASTGAGAGARAGVAATGAGSGWKPSRSGGDLRGADAMRLTRPREVHLGAVDALPADADLTVAGVGVEAAFAGRLTERVLLAVGELGDDGDVDLRQEIGEVQVRHRRDVALDVRHARQFLVAVHAVLAGDHRSFDRAG